MGENMFSRIAVCAFISQEMGFLDMKLIYAL